MEGRRGKDDGTSEASGSWVLACGVRDALTKKFILFLIGRSPEAVVHELLEVGSGCEQ